MRRASRLAIPLMIALASTAGLKPGSLGAHEGPNTAG